MGGSSTQLIFYNGSSDAQKIHADDFWAYSWLNYGAHKVQERVLDFIYTTDMNNRVMEVNSCTEEGANHDQCLQLHRTLIRNPCDFIGHSVNWKDAVLEGSGEGKKCSEMIERVIWPTTSNISDLNGDCFKGRPCPIEEIEHPSVKGHHFYAMSVYFYALDCMRQLGPGKLENW
jgi:hypothetical protein